MLYTLGQIKSIVAQHAGIQDENGNYTFSDTTYPTVDLANMMVNATIQEICGAWDYTFLETSKSYPFYHVISGVQSLYLEGFNPLYGISGTTFSGTITPYPTDVLNFAHLANNTVDNVNNNFSGIVFNGINSTAGPGGTTVYMTGPSYSGSVVYLNWTGVGYEYQLDPDIDKFLAPGVVIANSAGSNVGQGIILRNTPYEDIVRLIPIGVIKASGTPNNYFELPGLSPTNNKVIQFFPTPLPQYSGNNFIVNYKKKHVDLTDDSQIQNMIPEQWQNVIVQGVLEKVNSIRNPDRQPEANMRKEKLINNLKLWDAQQPSKMSKWRDANYNTNSNFMYDNSTWLSLGDGIR